MINRDESKSIDATTRTVPLGCGPLAATVGEKNPYRYRGYRYDTETGLYYLQSRYYNPEWGRFLNADALAGGMGTILSHNVFAYCENNPITYYDPDGYRKRRPHPGSGKPKTPVTPSPPPAPKRPIGPAPGSSAQAGVDKQSFTTGPNYAPSFEIVTFNEDKEVWASISTWTKWPAFGAGLYGFLDYCASQSGGHLPYGAAVGAAAFIVGSISLFAGELSTHDITAPYYPDHMMFPITYEQVIYISVTKPPSRYGPGAR